MSLEVVTELYLEVKRRTGVLFEDGFVITYLQLVLSSYVNSGNLFERTAFSLYFAILKLDC